MIIFHNFDQIPQFLPNFSYQAIQDNSDNANKAENTDDTDSADNADNANNTDNAYNLDKYFTMWTFSTIKPFFQ